MTENENIIYVPCLDHGFVRLVDHMGSDQSIVQAARVSYGDGTKSVREDRGLIRYLMRQRHTSPFEMCEVKLHVKLPIFVMRQLVRHRTSSLNEYSGRYSVMSKDFYVPELENIKSQDEINKQKSGESVSIDRAHDVQDLMADHFQRSYITYQNLLGNILAESPGPDGLFTPTDEGISKELARLVLPVSNYTECYWKQDLHNLFHLLKLRYDSHAQYEIRVFAKAIYDIVKPLFPMAVEAWEDYVYHSTSLSRMDMNLLQDIIQCSNFNGMSMQRAFWDIIKENKGRKNVLEKYGMTVREWNELTHKFGFIELFNAFAITKEEYPLLKTAINWDGVDKPVSINQVTKVSEEWIKDSDNMLVKITPVDKDKYNHMISSLREIFTSVQTFDYIM